MNVLLKKCIAECLGTFVLVFVACGVAAATGGSLVATSLAFGLTIVAMAYSVGRISGCHINPAVSLGCLLAGRMTVKEFLAYVCSQIVGAVIGGLVVFGCFKMADVAINFETGASNFCVGNNGDYSLGGVFSALIVEIILTFIFVYVILNVTDDKATEGDEYKRGTAQIAGIIIGLTLTLVHLIGICLTGTSVNPARSLGTAFANLIYGGSAKALSQVWIFFVGPLAGAALAAVAYKFLHKEDVQTSQSLSE